MSNGCCIIIPCYNEAGRIDLETYRLFINNCSFLHFLFVNDGSSDDTEKMLKDFCAETNSSYLSLKQNQGKAEAIRQGVCHLKDSSYEYIGFWDADLATPLEDIAKFHQLLKSRDELECVFGIRLKRLGAQVERKAVRHYIGRIFATLASLSLDLPVYDTQCGAKIFKASTLGQLCEKQFLSKWLFDVELIFRLKKLLSDKKIDMCIFEYPLEKWKDVHGSKLRLKDFILAPIDLLKIHFAYSK